MLKNVGVSFKEKGDLLKIITTIKRNLAHSCQLISGRTDQNSDYVFTNFKNSTFHSH